MGENISFPEGANLIFDSSYNSLAEIPMGEGGRNTFNIHEFNIVDGGNRVLRIVVNKKHWDNDSGEGGMVASNGFQEVDTITGEVVFEWDSLSHVLPSASFRPKPNGWGGMSPATWDDLSVRFISTSFSFMFYIEDKN
jgi:hypothetical protein